jgi:hypothetical protein
VTDFTLANMTVLVSQRNLHDDGKAGTLDAMLLKNVDMTPHPRISDLDCLILAPRGSEPDKALSQLITVLAVLCKRFGIETVGGTFDGIRQLAANPAKLAEFKQIKDDYLASMKPIPTEAAGVPVSGG